MNDKRLDIYMTEKFNLSRQKAQGLIKEKSVFVNQKIVTKVSFIVKENDIVEIAEQKYDFVSRGGYKLLKAIEDFDLDLQGKICLDIGASTGGFTQCMLIFGAEKVYAIDVGKGQLSPILADDSRVINIENTNIKEIDKYFDSIEKADFISVDLSFISLTKTLPVIKNLLKTDGKIICLIKPQFEAGKVNIKNGVIKDKKLHKSILLSLFDFFNQEKLYIYNFTFSPIKGQSGNIEYLVELRKIPTEKTAAYNINSVIDSAFEELKNK